MQDDAVPFSMYKIRLVSFSTAVHSIYRRLAFKAWWLQAVLGLCLVGGADQRMG